MAEHVDQPVDIPAVPIPFSSSAHYTSFSYASIGHFHSFTHIVNSQEDAYRL